MSNENASKKQSPEDQVRSAVKARVQNGFALPGNVRLGRVTDDEIASFKKQDLARYIMDKSGASLASDIATNPRSLSDGGTEYTLRYPGGGKVVVTQRGNGDWMFMNRDFSAKGDIRNFAAWNSGESYADTLHKLREEFRTRPSSSPIHQKQAQPAPQRRSYLDLIKDEAARVIDPAKLETIRQTWERMREGVSQYLAQRGITSATQQRFIDEMRIDGRGVGFAERNPQGEVIGIVRKGPKREASDVRDFSGRSTGSTAALTYMGERKAPERIYVAEKQIDAMSIFQHDGSPSKVLLVSPGGAPGNRAMGDLHELIRRHPGVPVHVAMDNDAAGQRFAEKAVEVVKLAREGADAGIVDRSPPPEFKDWNDVIRGKEWRPTEPEHIAEQEEARRRHAARQQSEPTVEADTTPPEVPERPRSLVRGLGRPKVAPAAPQRIADAPEAKPVSVQPAAGQGLKRTGYLRPFRRTAEETEKLREEERRREEARRIEEENRSKPRGPSR